MARDLLADIGLALMTAALHHTISRTWAASACPNVIGPGSLSCQDLVHRIIHSVPFARYSSRGRLKDTGIRGRTQLNEWDH